MLCLRDRIRAKESSLQPLLCAVEEAPTLTAVLVAVWSRARPLAIHVVESVRAERARRPTSWPPCPVCGTCVQSQGVVKRQVPSLCGPRRWRRRVGRGPQSCPMPPVAPVEDALGVAPHQRTRGDLQAFGWALAVCVPVAPAATLLGWYRGRVGSPQAGWGWVQAAGQRAMATLQEHLDALATGVLPPEEPLAAAPGVLPLRLGADGVMGPRRPQEKTPQGTTPWRAVTVGRLARVGHHRTRAGPVGTRRHPRRVVAVLGAIEALRPRLWLAAVRPGMTSASRVVWLSAGARGVGRLREECLTTYAPGVLDFSHAAQHLGKGAAAWLEGRPTQARRWCASARHRLRHRQADGGFADLREA